MIDSKDKFIVKFRGVRGSHPKPERNFLEYGGNTACVEVHVNNHLIILDAGTGIINCGNELMQEQIAQAHKEPINATILLSHLHNDHIMGLPFFKPVHQKDSNINIVGFSAYEEGLDNVISQLVFEKSFPLGLNEINAKLSFYDINDSYALILDENDNTPDMIKIEKEEDAQPQDEEVVISCLKSNSHPKEGVMIYKIAYKDKSLVYATDKESYAGGDKKLVNFARGCNLLIHDSQYTTEDYMDSFNPKQGYGHSTFDMAVEAKNQSGAEKLVFFHYDPGYDDNKLNSIKEQFNQTKENTILAYEGLEIDLL